MKRLLTEATIVGRAILVTLCRCETALGRAVHFDGVSLAEKSCSDSGVRLGHGVSVHHASHVSSVPWHLLSTHLMLI